MEKSDLYYGQILNSLQNPWFKKSRYRQGRAKKINVGGKGLGFRERPGLGASAVNEVSTIVPAVLNTVATCSEVYLLEFFRACNACRN